MFRIIIKRKFVIMKGDNFLTPVSTCQVRRATRGAHLTAFVVQKLGAQREHTGGWKAEIEGQGGCMGCSWGCVQGCGGDTWSFPGECGSVGVAAP